MEAGIMEYMKEVLQIPKVDVRTYSPLSLAYMGDCVFELLIRTMLVSEANQQVNKYHKKAASLVKAEAQAELITRLLPHLTEEESTIYKRGRNAKSHTVAKNATTIDYRMATGFEALIGYLYLSERYERVIDLVKIGLKTGEKE